MGLMLFRFHRIYFHTVHVASLLWFWVSCNNYMDRVTLEILPEFSYTYKRAVCEEGKHNKIKWNKWRYFDVLLTVHLSIFISVINQLDAQNFCFTISLFHASTCFEHICSKHVEAWNKLSVKQKFCASSWLITEIKMTLCFRIPFIC